MTKYLFIALFSLAALCTALPVMDGDVYVLSADNFDDSLNTIEGPWLVKFFTPWCGHCKHLAPIYKEAAHAVQGRLNMAEVDCTEHSTICNRYGVRGYPSLKTFLNGAVGKEGDYKGGRSVEAFVQFADFVSGPPVKELGEGHLKEAITAGKNGDRVTFVYFGSELPEDYVEAAKGRRDRLIFAHVDGVLAEGVGMKTDSIAVFRDGKPEVYDGAIDIATWIDANCYLVLPELNQETYQDILLRDLPVIVAAIDPRNTKSIEYRTKFKDALALSGDDRFVYAWINAQVFEEFLRSIGMMPDAVPAVMSFDGKNNKQTIAPPAVNELTDSVAINGWLDETHALWVKRQSFMGKWTEIAGSLMELGVQYWWVVFAALLGLIGCCYAIWNTSVDEPDIAIEEKVEKKDE